MSAHQIKQFILRELPDVSQEDLDIMDPAEINAIYQELKAAAITPLPVLTNAEPISDPQPHPQSSSIDPVISVVAQSKTERKWKPNCIARHHQLDTIAMIQKQPQQKQKNGMIESILRAYPEQAEQVKRMTEKEVQDAYNLIFKKKPDRLNKSKQIAINESQLNSKGVSERGFQVQLTKLALDENFDPACLLPVEVKSTHNHSPPLFLKELDIKQAQMLDERVVSANEQKNRHQLVEIHHKLGVNIDPSKENQGLGEIECIDQVAAGNQDIQQQGVLQISSNENKVQKQSKSKLRMEKRQRRCSVGMVRDAQTQTAKQVKKVTTTVIQSIEQIPPTEDSSEECKLMDQKDGNRSLDMKVELVRRKMRRKELEMNHISKKVMLELENNPGNQVLAKETLEWISTIKNITARLSHSIVKHLNRT